jgi:putative component of membrane protein insertase Oxa1/YidC/SpoIIIJ protein YidD
MVKTPLTIPPPNLYSYCHITAFPIARCYPCITHGTAISPTIATSRKGSKSKKKRNQYSWIPEYHF